MKPRIILASIALALSGWGAAQSAPRDDVVVQMAQAFRQGDKARLAQLLPQTRGHLLEPWAAYWELRARLDTASVAEVQAFFARYADTYQEDRLRNDWLLLLGQRRDWTAFADEHPRFRMNDDREVRCYALLVRWVRDGVPAAQLADEVRRLWFAQREADDGCALAASRLLATPGGLSADDAWRKARLALEANRPRAAAQAVEMVAPEAMGLFNELNASPALFLNRRVAALSRVRREVIGLALVKLATVDADAAAALVERKWGWQIGREERDWIWAVLGKQAAQRLDTSAMRYFSRVEHDPHLSDDLLAWKARAALRAGAVPQWKSLLQAIEAMGEEGQREPAWIYWRARALNALARSDLQRGEARQLLQGLASPRGFYEQLALEELDQPVVAPVPPAAPTAQERAAVRQNPGFNRALQAIALGLRSEGVREWNYSAHLAQPGGLPERELLAAAQWACEREVWDRCINTSERTPLAFDASQRFPTPFRDAVLRRCREIGLDPAYVYGLIRQESRFVMDARSSVGASGLMQVMPATARWTARKIGWSGFAADQLSDRDTNIAIGTSYLKLVLDDFNGSLPLAAAAYNAGPGRPRAWRNGPVMEGAAWAETIPFSETRDYVKKVLANTTLYAALFSGQPQSLKARLGQVGPREASLPEPSRELP